ncbi:MAG: hypothetical protein AAF578_10135 [Pseudomonadota bacterium]
MSTDVNPIFENEPRTSGSNWLTRAAATGYIADLGWSDRIAHWFLRIPLAVLIWSYGIQKFPSVFTNPGDFGVPAVLYVLNGLAEVLGVIALIVGGIVETWNPKHNLLRLGGDVITRTAGFALASAIGGVIYFFYWGSITLSNPHTMQFGLALFFMLRGNKLIRARQVELPTANAAA